MWSILLPVVLVGVALDAAFIVTEYRKKYVAAVVLKGLASLVFVVLGLICMQKAAGRPFALSVLLGLMFGALGDILLNLRMVLEKGKDKIFAAGIAVFLIGHLLYILALILRDASAALYGIPAAAVLALILIPLVLKRIDAPSKQLRAFGVVYLAVVVVMFGCAAALAILHWGEGCSLLFALGALLFLISDFVLVFNLFGRKKHPSLRAINLSLYYVGQLLIALCLLFA